MNDIEITSQRLDKSLRKEQITKNKVQTIEFTEQIIIDQDYGNTISIFKTIIEKIYEYQQKFQVIFLFDILFK